MLARASCVVDAATLKSLATPKSRKVKVISENLGGSDGHPVAHISFNPQARKVHENGWQSALGDVRSRVAVLFNSATMSDVIFHVGVHGIPAHKFVLASASPVFFKQFYEARPHTSRRRDSALSQSLDSVLMPFGGESEGGGQHTHIMVDDVPHLAFYEFLQFLYCDTVAINLDNVLHLLLLSESYRVGKLGQECLEFLRAQVVIPKSITRVLKIVRTIELKATFGAWCDSVRKRKALQKFQELTISERRAAVQGGEAEATSSGAPSGAPSRSASRSSRRSDRSVAPPHAFKSRPSVATYRDFDTDGLSLAQEFLSFYQEDVADYSSGDTRRPIKFDHAFKGATFGRVGSFCQDLIMRCWKCVQEETDSILGCPDVWDQDRDFIRQLLQLGSVAVSEIALFRAGLCWAQHQCRRKGLVPNAENVRSTIGPETLDLIRFPTMTLEQVQWEVIPAGVLPYEDVQQLLHTMAHKSNVLGKYNTTPRCHKTLRKGRERSVQQTPRRGSPGEAQDALQDVVAPTYLATPGDPVDAMLSTELLRQHLNRTLDENAPPPETLPKAAEATFERLLPPITPRATSEATLEAVRSLGLGRSPGASPRRGPPSSHSASLASLSTLSMSRNTSRLLLAPHSELPPAEGAGVLAARPVGRPCRASDFVRLAPGLYRFRGERLLEMWVHNGDAVVKDHGPLSPDAVPADLAGADPSAIRRLLGLPDAPPTHRGVPLPAFLECR